MKRLNVKQMVLYVGGILMCQISWMGCFPLIPAFFTAVCLEDAARLALSAAMFVGIILFDRCGSEISDGDRCNLNYDQIV